jgi:type 1 glutamine amidotransferase
MEKTHKLLVALMVMGGVPAVSQAVEKDVFDYPAQKAAGKSVKKIVFVADPGSHGARGNHEFLAAAILFARTINAAYPNTAYCVVHSKDHWPKDLSHADAIIVLLNHGGSAVNPAVEAAVDRGAGFMGIHYSVEVTKGRQGDAFLKWLGGYFETYWSVNPHWSARAASLPNHPTTRGVKPFAVTDEWYYHMRFVDAMAGVTPILTAIPPVTSLHGGGSSERGNNPAVAAEVAAGKPQVLAWAYERPNGGGRGFGFTGLHVHANLVNDDFRTVLLNAIAWTAGLEVPAAGVPSRTPTPKQLEDLIDEGHKAVREYGI